jgi:hypothetical protein
MVLGYSVNFTLWSKNEVSPESENICLASQTRPKYNPRHEAPKSHSKKRVMQSTSPTGFEPMPPKRIDVEVIQVNRLNHSATVTATSFWVKKYIHSKIIEFTDYPAACTLKQDNLSENLPSGK